MLATFPKSRSRRRVSASSVREMLLEAAYRLHATRVVGRLPARDDRQPKRGNTTKNSSRSVPSA
jgi:hypothetical protein